MAGTRVRRSASLTDLLALDRALLALLKAQAAAEEAFGPGSAEVDALNVVFAAIKQAARCGVSAPATGLIRQPHLPDGEPDEH